MSNIGAKSVKALLALVLATLGLVGVGGMSAGATTSPAPLTAATALQPDCGDTSGYDTAPLSSLPAQAGDTYDLIRSGGPYPYPQDGTTFQNREQLLPACASGYYAEYTVETPGSSDRGARRIVAGDGGEYFYTADHYESFTLITF